MFPGFKLAFFEVFALHHHLIPIPRTGRGNNVRWIRVTFLSFLIVQVWTLCSAGIGIFTVLQLHWAWRAWTRIYSLAPASSQSFRWRRKRAGCGQYNITVGLRIEIVLETSDFFYPFPPSYSSFLLLLPIFPWFFSFNISFPLLFHPHQYFTLLQNLILLQNPGRLCYIFGNNL